MRRDPFRRSDVRRRDAARFGSRIASAFLCGALFVLGAAAGSAQDKAAPGKEGAAGKAPAGKEAAGGKAPAGKEAAGARPAGKGAADRGKK